MIRRLVAVLIAVATILAVPMLGSSAVASTPPTTAAHGYDAVTATSASTLEGSAATAPRVAPKVESIALSAGDLARSSVVFVAGEATTTALPKLGAKPNFGNTAEAPGKGWEWRGTGDPGSSKGSWYNPNSGESLHPDLGHPDPIGPHYDWKAPNGTTYRVYPDGTVAPK